MNIFYEDDLITLLHGDAVECLLDIPRGSIDSIVTDPPYGINLQPPRKKTKSIANDLRDDTKKLMGDSLPILFSLLKDNSASLMFGGWSETWVKDLLSEFFNVKGCIVWKKTNFGIGYYLRPQWELIWYLHKGKPNKPKKALSDVWEEKRVHKPIHSCQKPVILMEKAIGFTSEEGSLILDPFCGVGSTLVAAKNLGVNAIGIEISEEYCEIAAKRIQESYEKTT